MDKPSDEPRRDRGRPAGARASRRRPGDGHGRPPRREPEAPRPRSSRGDFTHQADAYVRARPGYPEELVGRLLDQAGLSRDAGDLPVADIGAGTGILTALLAERRLRITALEPNEAMRSRAPRLEGVVWADGTFENTGLAAASQHWIVAAQAFHWARPELALPELHRVLRPGGRFTVLWNNRDNASSEVLSFTRAAILRLVPDFDEGYRNRDWAAVLTSTGHFAEPVEISVRHVIPMDLERYLDLWRSHNVLSSTAGPEGVATVLRELEDRLAGVERVEVPYLCRSWTVRRVPGR